MQEKCIKRLLNKNIKNSIVLIKCHVASGFSQISSGDMNCKFSLKLTEQSSLLLLVLKLIYLLFIMYSLFMTFIRIFPKNGSSKPKRGTVKILPIHKKLRKWHPYTQISSQKWQKLETVSSVKVILVRCCSNTNEMLNKSITSIDHTKV